MRNLKFSFAFVIAILAVGLTVASKANMLGSRAITACYISPQLTNGAATPILFAPAPSQNCATVRNAITAQNTQWLNQLLAPATDANCVTSKLVYCCITFDLDPVAPANVPVLNVGGQVGKFKVIEVRCKD